MPYSKVYYETHKEEVKASNKLYIKAHKEEVKAYQHTYHKIYNQVHSEELKTWRKVYLEGHRKENIAWGKTYREKTREMVLAAYGGCCTCCGETENHFLSIDHINGGGNKHKKEINRSNIYRWLVENNYPKDNFQILCFNCNMAKGFWGICPHQLKNEKEI